MLFHLLGKIFPCARVGQVQPVLVDQHGLVLDPALPGFLGNALVDALAELTGVGWQVQPFGLAPELDALHHPCHGRCSVLAGATILARIVFAENAAQELRSVSPEPSSAAGSCTTPSHPSGARLDLDVPQQALSVALVTVIRPHREAGELARTGAQERVERRTADDDTVVFDDGKARDLALEQLAPPAYERSVLLERLDKLQNSARVVDRGGTQFHHLVRSDHRARALVREKLDQQGTWEFAADDMGALHASADRLDRMRQIEPGVRRESVAAREQLGSLLRGQLG